MKNLVIGCFLVALPLGVFSQQKPLRIVFDVTSSDTVTHQAVVRHVKGMTDMYPGAELEVVVFGGALPMVVSEKSTVGNAVRELANHNNVSFRICGLSMKRYGVKSSQLIPGVEVVPDAIIEIVTKQGEGWGYIKEAHN